MTGYIYCLTNTAIPGLVKIGKTARDPRKRAAEISASTGVPTPFEIVWTRQVANAATAEADLHAALVKYRVNNRREFFRCTPKQALARSRRLRSFGAVKRSPNLDVRHGLAQTVMFLAVFGGAIAFDLEASTIATAIAGCGLAVTLAFQSVPLIGALRG